MVVMGGAGAGGVKKIVKKFVCDCVLRKVDFPSS